MPSPDEKFPTTDPVCGMTVTPSEETASFVYDGRTYYFCSRHCEQKFSADPGRYAMAQPSSPKVPIIREGKGPKSEPAKQPAATMFTCPMHPEVIQDHPGACPKCGMALEPSTAIAAEENPELADMTRRFWISTALSIPVFLLAMTSDLLPSLLPSGLSMHVIQWIEFALATPVVLWGGWPFFVRGWKSVRTWNLNMFTLIGLGVSVAWGYSVVALLFPSIFPPVMRMKDGSVDVYFEAAAVITALVLLGQVLELRARSRTNAAIQLLLGLAPKTARLVRPDGAGRGRPAGKRAGGRPPPRAPRREDPGGRDGDRGQQQRG